MSGQANKIDVTPEQLRGTASLFYTASQDTFTLLDDLNGTARQLIDDMYAELRHAPDSLQRLCDRWRDATISLGNALEQVSKNLDIAADDLTATDQRVMP